MKSNSKNKNNHEKQLRFENELEKLKLSATHGAKFFTGENVPPEVENEWLKNIIEFEDQFENCKQIKIRTRLGEPEYPKPEALEESEISEKLDELQQLMFKNNVSLSTLADVPKVELYRFITEELFEEEIDDIRIDGFMNCFIYEEFHPNAKIDAENEMESFFMHFLDKDMQEYLFMNFSETVETKDGVEISRDDFVKQLHTFLEQYDEMELSEFEIHNIEINEKEEEASVEFFVDYKGAKQSKCVSHKGESYAKLRKSPEGYWQIYSLSIPFYPGRE